MLQQNPNTFLKEPYFYWAFKELCNSPVLYSWTTNSMLMELGTIINYYKTINLTQKQFCWWHVFLYDVIKLSKNHELCWFHLYRILFCSFENFFLVRVIFMSNASKVNITPMFLFVLIQYYHCYWYVYHYWYYFHFFCFWFLFWFFVWFFTFALHFGPVSGYWVKCKHGSFWFPDFWSIPYKRKLS